MPKIKDFLIIVRQSDVRFRIRRFAKLDEFLNIVEVNFVVLGIASRHFLGLYFNINIEFNILSFILGKGQDTPRLDLLGKTCLPQNSMM